MKYILTLAIQFSFLINLFSQEKKLPESMLCSPVLVICEGNSYGSGIFMIDSNKVYFVTARHVLFLNDSTKLKYLHKKIELFFYSSNISDKYVSINIKVGMFSKNDTIVRFDKGHDIAVILIGHIITTKDRVSEFRTVQGVDITNCPTGITGTSINDIKNYEQSSIG